MHLGPLLPVEDVPAHNGLLHGEAGQPVALVQREDALAIEREEDHRQLGDRGAQRAAGDVPVADVAQHALAPVLHETEAHGARDHRERVDRRARGLDERGIDLREHAERQRVEEKTDECDEEPAADSEKTARDRGHEAEQNERGLPGHRVQRHERDGVGLDDDQGEEQTKTAR